MDTTLRRRLWRANGKRVTNRLVFQRYAALKRISERTAEDYYSGRCGPVVNAEAMVAIAASSGRADLAVAIIRRLRRAAETTPPEYRGAWVAYNRAQAAEDSTQADFDDKEREGTATVHDARQRLKSVTFEALAAQQYADALAVKYDL